MNFSHRAHSYRQVAAHTASPGQLVLMLFDGAIGFLDRALAGFQQDDPLHFHQTIHNNITRAQAILHELNVCLDMEQGGEFAGTMRRLYDYFGDRLQQSNARKQDDGVREVLRHLTILRDAWAEMMRKIGSDASRETATAFSAMG